MDRHLRAASTATSINTSMIDRRDPTIAPKNGYSKSFPPPAYRALWAFPRVSQPGEFPENQASLERRESWMDFVVIISTDGGVLSRLLPNPYFRQRIRCVVSDRDCGAIAKATAFDVPTIVHRSASGLEFSDFLMQSFSHDPPTLFVSFYTRLFRGEFLAFAKDNLVNLHPSILPACPGRDGFGDTLKSKSRFIGATVHLVDGGIDTGTPIIQSAAPYDPGKSVAENRHTVFVQQCKMLLQAIKYVDEKRLAIDGSRNVHIEGAKYAPGEFSPNLDDDLPF